MKETPIEILRAAHYEITRGKCLTACQQEAMREAVDALEAGEEIHRATRHALRNHTRALEGARRRTKEAQRQRAASRREAEKQRGACQCQRLRNAERHAEEIGRRLAAALGRRAR